MTAAEDAIAALAAKQGIENSVSPASLAATLTAIYNELRTNSGFSSYSDTQYTSIAPFTIPADTDTILPNNAGTVYNAQKPDFVVGELYDGAEIKGRNGDGIDIMIYYFAVPTNVSQYVETWIDIGAPVGRLYTDTKQFPKGVGVPAGVLYSLSSAYTRGTWEANGGTVYVRSNHPLDVYGMVFNIDVNHRALPEV